MNGNAKDANVNEIIMFICILKVDGCVHKFGLTLEIRFDSFGRCRRALQICDTYVDFLRINI